MTRVEKLKEIKELEFYVSASKRDCSDMLKRVEWLKSVIVKNKVRQFECRNAMEVYREPMKNEMSSSAMSH